MFCLHGGLSPEIKDINEISKISRVQEVPDSGVISDLLWSDPDEKDGWTISPRGAGSLFGSDISKQFCYINKVDMILRAHQLVMEGYSWTHNDNVCTLFSAPNYCSEFDNLGGVMIIDENLMCSFKSIKSSEDDDKKKK